MSKFLQWFTQVTPLRLALVIALLFIVAHLVIEAGTFEFGVLSRKGYLRTLDLKMLDTKFSQASRPELPEAKVVVAAIDEESIDRFGRFPWSRNILADFIDRVAAEKPKAIAFDVVFSDPDKNSSYVSVKKFLDAYDASELGPKSKAFATLTAQVSEAEASFNKAEAKAATLRARLKKDENKSAYLKLLADTSLEAERAQRRLTTARTALKELEEERNRYREMLQGEISAVSPDDRFAESIKNAGNVVLGYFAFESKEAMATISADKAQQDVDVLEPAAIGGLYEAYIEDFGGATVERFVAKDVDWKNLQLKEAKGFQSPLKGLASSTDRFGFFNSVIDSDNQMRRLRLLYKAEDKMYPALSVQAAALYLDAGIFPEDGGINPGVTVDGVNLGTELLVTTDPQSKMLVNYYADPQEYFPVCGIAALLDGRCEALGDDLTRLKDKVILVGATAIGTFDVRPIAFGAVPGVFIHAQGIQNMIDELFLERFSGIQLFEVALFLLSGLFLGLILPRVPPWASLLVTLALVLGYYAVDIYFIFPKGYWLLNVFPTLQWTTTLGAIVFFKYLTEGREKRQIRQAFQFYLTKSVVDEMLKDTTKLKLGGERRVCTVLFSDIRGFTTISESLEPEELSALLNEYLTPMTNLVFKYDGTLDKYMGDAIMAIFGAPVPYEDHAGRACHVALDMMDELQKLRDQWAAEGREHSMDIGIGLNTGPMSVGNMGSEVRFDYTVMGDQVNLGSRLEGINKQYGTNIIISEFTYEAARGDIHARELDLVRVKGKNEPVRIYELMGRGKAVGNTADLISQFERGIQAYRAQNWNDAIALFTRVREELKPGDFASQMYIERCEQLRATTMDAGWDGVFTMTTK